MIKIVTALIIGILFTFFLDFFWMLGIFLNYIQGQDIDVYYNVLFADHQNFYLFFSASIFFGYLAIFCSNKTVKLTIFALSFVAVSLTLIPTIGKKAGEMMLSVENKIISVGRYDYIGKIVYDGRNTIWFYDDELKKIVSIDKSEATFK